MADFYQTGVVTTLHRFKPNHELPQLEEELEKFSENTAICLVLPALYSEFQGQAMRGILEELKHVRYLRHIVVALAKANQQQYEDVKSLFAGHPQEVTVLWIDGERIQALFERLEKQGLTAGGDGKGRSCWLAYGYLLAATECDVIALHDCDIVNYDRLLLARLCYPVAHPNLGFEFCKGYYARITDRMHGRVTRLFMAPLIRAMESMYSTAPFLKFLDSFRYPLAGEFAMKADLAQVNRIPGDWGLEVGVLAEVFRNCAVSRTCQVDLADTYEHKHQSLSEHDPDRGLRRMATDIAKCLFRTLAAEGLVYARGSFRSLGVRYVRLAEDTIARYYADALLNGLKFDRHAEELAVATFARSLQQAAEEFTQDPLGLPLIPNWNRVVAAIPDFFTQLQMAVIADNEWVLQPQGT
ncbi:MAG: glycosyl transferase [Terriglobia bacterium]